MMEKHILTIITQMSSGPSMNYFICLFVPDQGFSRDIILVHRRRSLTSDFDANRQWVCLNSRDTPTPLAKWVHSMLVLWGVILVVTVTDPTQPQHHCVVGYEEILFEALDRYDEALLGQRRFSRESFFLGQKTGGFCCMNMQHSRNHVIYIYTVCL